MRLIKKLIILSGKGRGSLMLEKNAYGVTGKLSLNGIDGQNRRLIVISGGDSFITKIGGEKVKVEMGDIDYDEIHAAVISDTEVLLYGSNCPTKLSEERIMNEAKELSRRAGDNAIKYSGVLSPGDYFKNIKPYDDYAIAEKNYFELHTKTLSDEQKSGMGASEKQNTVNESQVNIALSNTVKENAAEDIGKSEQSNDYAGDYFYRLCVRSVFGSSATLLSLNAKQIRLNDETKTGTSAVRDKLYYEKLSAQAKEDACSVVSVSDADEVKPTCSISDTDAFKEETPNEPTLLRADPLSVKGPKRFVSPQAGKNNEQRQNADYPVKKSDTSDYRQNENSVRSLRDKTNNSSTFVAAAHEDNFTIRGRDATFYEKNSVKVSKLFSSYERCKEIEQVIPGSRFVKIMYDDRRYYVVGLVDDYICYGVPSESDRLPEAFSGYGTYLSVGGGRGYYMLYQDGVTGKTLSKKS